LDNLNCLGAFVSVDGRNHLFSLQNDQKSSRRHRCPVCNTFWNHNRNISLVKILGLEKQELERIDVANRGILDLELLKIRKIRSMEFIQGTLINAIRVGLLGTMFWMIYKGFLTLGEFFSFFFYSFFVFAPLGQLGTIMKNYQEAKASHDALEDIMKLPPAPTVQNPTPIQTIKHIALEKV